jgi:proliferating cell nuclear antigen
VSETKTKQETEDTNTKGEKAEGQDTEEVVQKKHFGLGPFTLKLENSKVLKTIVETLSSIIDETTFTITPQEFRVKAMDPSRICLLQLIITRENFDSFECDEPVKVSLNLDDLGKIMKRAASSDAITLVHEDEAHRIKVLMRREEQSRSRTFSLGLLDLDIEEIPMGSLLSIEYSSGWSTDPDFLKEAIKDAEIYSEIINIEARENIGLTYSSAGQIGEMKYELGLENFLEEDIAGEEKGSYSVVFLKAILKLQSITEALRVSLKTDHPIKMEFDLLEGGKLSYFLAPRVEETTPEGEEEFLEEM